MSEKTNVAGIAAGLSKLAARSKDDDGHHAESVPVSRILEVLGQFQECVRYLNTRRTSGAILRLESEADVQDALFIMLRPWLSDLVYENPTGKIGARYAIKDFLIPSCRCVIEAKFVRARDHGRRLSAELHTDIENYRCHPHCDAIIFFIYDPNGCLAEMESLRSSIEIERIYGGKSVACHLVVKP